MISHFFANIFFQMNIRAQIQAAMKEHAPQQVTVTDGAGVTVVQQISHDKPTSISQNLVRIQQEADPLGFLMRIARGEPIPHFTVTSSGVEVEYQTPTLGQQITTARYLADKYMPKLSVHQISSDNDKQIDGHSWEAVVAKAAINAGSAQTIEPQGGVDAERDAAEQEQNEDQLRALAAINPNHPMFRKKNA